MVQTSDAETASAFVPSDSPPDGLAGRAGVPWPVLGALVATLAVGLGIKVVCTAGTLTLGEAGIPGCYSDVVGIFQARGLAADPLPYRDVLTEYPPLTALQWWTAQSLSTTATGFLVATAAISGLATLIGLVVVGRLRGRSRRLLLYAMAPSVLLATFVNWDPVAVALMLAAIAAHVRGGHRAASILAGLGALAKLFPAVVVPLMAWSLAARGRPRQAAEVIGIATLTILVGLAITLPWAGDGVWAMVTTNIGRPADWDSVWFWIARVTNLALPPAAVNAASLIVTLAGWIVILARGRSLPATDRWVLALPLLIWFLLAGKVYSPQFSLWLIPLVVLLVSDTRLVVAFLVSDALVFLTRFPFLSGEQGLDTIVPTWAFVTALAARAVVLLAILIATSERRTAAGLLPPRQTAVPST